jgi:putative glutamine amidotransferase
MKPVIGVTTFIDRKPRAEYASVQEHYAHSVFAGGGLPFLVPIMRGEDARGAADWLGRLDGILFTGGLDVSPLRYGQAVSPKVEDLSSDRDEWELALCREAFRIGLPMLGICRGHQLINVALGGTLIQDIPSQLPSASSHSSDMPPEEPSHYVEIEDEDSRLYASLGRAFGSSRVLTNSFHHQAVDALAPGLVVTAHTADGVLEAFESKEEGRFLVGVQFHPECLTRRYPGFVALFAALAEAAASYRSALGR